MDLEKLRREGGVLVAQALDGFVDRPDLNVNYTVAGVEVSSKSGSALKLEAAAARLIPVFSRAGWGSRQRAGFRRGTLVFSPPAQASTPRGPHRRGGGGA